MPLRKPDQDAAPPVQRQPFQHRRNVFEAELTPEAIKAIQAEADKVLDQEEWVVIDGVGQR